MTQEQFNALRATFPWTERVTQDRRGGVVQIIDRYGHEVPLFTMTRFLAFITNRLMPTPESPK